MKPLILVEDRNRCFTVDGYREQRRVYYVLTSVGGVQAIANEEEAVEAVKLGKFKIDRGDGIWVANGPSSNYLGNPRWLKLKTVQRFVEYTTYVKEEI